MSFANVYKIKIYRDYTAIRTAMKNGKGTMQHFLNAEKKAFIIQKLHMILLTAEHLIKVIMAKEGSILSRKLFKHNEGFNLVKPFTDGLKVYKLSQS